MWGCVVEKALKSLPCRVMNCQVKPGKDFPVPIAIGILFYLQGKGPCGKEGLLLT
jgi:hypothetical protein